VARLFVSLKLHLLANALRSSTKAKVSFIVSTVFAVLMAAGTFTVLALLHGQAASVDVTTVIFTFFAFGWLILPLIAFGVDNTLDPATLALYPRRTGPLAVGLLAASATGAWPAANLIGLLGVSIGLAAGPFGVLVSVVAVLLEVLFCIALARLVTTGMARVLRSRRGKDLAAFLIVPLVACYELFSQVVPRLAAAHQLTTASFAGVDSWLRWLPPGLAAHAIQDASQGRVGPALGRLGLLAGVTVVLALLWVRVLGRALVTTDATTHSASVRAVRLPLARFGLRGAVAARSWIYQRRDPLSLSYWGINAVIMVAASASTLVGNNRHLAVLYVSSILGAAFVGVFHTNAIGMAGPAFVTEATALTDQRSLRAYLSGLDLTLAAIAVPLLVAVSFGLAALAGDPSYGYTCAAVDLAGLGAALGISNILSVTAAYPMDRRSASPMPTAAQGYAILGVLGTFANLAVVAVAAIPVLVAIVDTSGDPAAIRLPLLLAGGAAYGLFLAWSGVRLAALAAVNKLPELCQIAIRTSL
jgi:ABC-2 type transport system permease protein